MTTKPQSWHEAIDAHCRRFLGRCATAYGEIVPSAVPVTLYPHLASDERPWVTLRTGGVSDYPMAVPGELEEARYASFLPICAATGRS